MTIQIYLSKTITVVGLPPNIATNVSNRLTFENPEFRDKLLKQESVEGIEPYIYLYRYVSEDNILEIPRGFYENLIKVIENNGIDYKLFDLTADVYCTYPQHNTILRDYQETPVQQVIKEFQSNPSFILQATTGAGKTVLALYIAASLGVKTLWLTDKDNLFKQAKERVIERLLIPEEDIGEIAGTTWKIGNQITIGMIPTLYNRDLSLIEHEFGLVVVDECVLVPTKRCLKVVTGLAPRRTLGLTAFAERGDGLTGAIHALIGNIKVDVPPAGVIYPLVIRRHTHRKYFFDMRKHIKLPFLFERQIIRDKIRNNLIIEDIGLYHNKFTTIVLSKSVDHLENLKEAFEQRFKTQAVITHSDTSKLTAKQRDKNERDFLDGKYNTMFATYGMLAVGYDYPKLDRLIWACPFSSENWAFQSLGRPARTHKGKKGAIVIDYIDDCQRLEQQARIRENICKRKGLRTVTREGKDYLTDEDKDLLFQCNDSS